MLSPASSSSPARTSSAAGPASGVEQVRPATAATAPPRWRRARRGRSALAWRVDEPDDVPGGRPMGPEERAPPEDHLPRLRRELLPPAAVGRVTPPKLVSPTYRPSGAPGSTSGASASGRRRRRPGGRRSSRDPSASSTSTHRLRTLGVLVHGHHAGAVAHLDPAAPSLLGSAAAPAPAASGSAPVVPSGSGAPSVTEPSPRPVPETSSLRRVGKPRRAAAPTGRARRPRGRRWATA